MASSTNMIILRSSDRQSFEVEKAAMQYGIIKDLIEGDQIDIPLPTINSNILAKVIEYCRMHADDRVYDNEEDLKLWDEEFLRVDQATLFDLILAAHYLNIKSLLELMCEAVTDMIRGKSHEELRKTFNLEPYPPEEWEEIRRENQWAFE